jgi:CheY-like chemotaxis protein
VGKGTGVSVWLPSDTAKLASNPGLRRVAPPELRRGRVLVIDDEPAIGVAIERLLGKAHEVVALTDPVEALARLRRGERFDLILCDVMMPRLSGPELFESVEKDAADAAGSFFFLSGGAFNPSAHDFVEKHRKRLVEKPATAARLRELLHARLS